VWVLWAEVIAGVTVICPCCRVRIRLVDESGSAQVAPQRLEEALGELERTLRRLFS
jgi:hypothetical protein